LFLSVELFQSLSGSVVEEKEREKKKKRKSEKHVLARKS
jgi:hypothetical protein